MTIIATARTAAVSLLCGFLGAYAALATAAPNPSSNLVAAAPPKNAAATKAPPVATKAPHAVSQVTAKKIVIVNNQGNPIVTIGSDANGLPDMRLKSADGEQELRLGIVMASDKKNRICNVQLINAGGNALCELEVERDSANVVVSNAGERVGLMEADAEKVMVGIKDTKNRLGALRSNNNEIVCAVEYTKEHGAIMRANDTDVMSGVSFGEQRVAGMKVDKNMSLNYCQGGANLSGISADPEVAGLIVKASDGRVAKVTAQSMSVSDKNKTVLWQEPKQQDQTSAQPSAQPSGQSDKELSREP